MFKKLIQVNTLKTLLFILFISTTYFLQAQINSNDSNLMIGKVIDESSKLTVPLVNIFNESKRRKDNTDEEGYFQIKADIGDTLVFSAVGYFSLLIFVDTLLIEDAVIKLEPRIYEIGEATVKSLKKYSQFKQDVINLKLPRTPLDSINDELSKTLKQVALKADYDRKVKEIFARDKGTLFAIGSSIPSKTDKDKKALKKVVTAEKQQNIINLKYNYELVEKLTNLHDDEVTTFMLFCNFTNEFLLNATEYEIAKSIIEKFEEYKKTHP